MLVPYPYLEGVRLGESVQEIGNTGNATRDLQAWWPKMICAGNSTGRFLGFRYRTSAVHWNVPAWFMSALMFYWVLFAPLYRALRRIPRKYLLHVDDRGGRGRARRVRALPHRRTVSQQAAMGRWLRRALARRCAPRRSGV